MIGTSVMKELNNLIVLFAKTGERVVLYRPD